MKLISYHILTISNILMKYCFMKCMMMSFKFIMSVNDVVWLMTYVTVRFGNWSPGASPRHLPRHIGRQATNWDCITISCDPHGFVGHDIRATIHCIRRNRKWSDIWSGCRWLVGIPGLLSSIPPQVHKSFLPLPTNYCITSPCVNTFLLIEGQLDII